MLASESRLSDDGDGGAGRPDTGQREAYKQSESLVLTDGVHGGSDALSASCLLFFRFPCVAMRCFAVPPDVFAAAPRGVHDSSAII